MAPDIPLILLTVAFLAKDLLSGTLGGNGSSVEHLFRFQFFYDPWVITAHNLFHAPLLILALRRRSATWRGGAGCAGGRRSSGLRRRACCTR